VSYQNLPIQGTVVVFPYVTVNRTSAIIVVEVPVTPLAGWTGPDPATIGAIGTDSFLLYSIEQWCNSHTLLYHASA
jgi:hypothetical protein